MLTNFFLTFQGGIIQNRELYRQNDKRTNGQPLQWYQFYFLF